jgi:predicted DCC family thiol-disulfide oxidoreductase YuxK
VSIPKIALVTNAWTGGQYSIFRAFFGATLFVHFIECVFFGTQLLSNAGPLANASASPLYPLIPNILFVWDSPAAVTMLIAIGAVASIALLIGWRDRIAALVLWVVWACLFIRSPLISNPDLPIVGLLLLVHAVLPARPFGSWDARGRLDPDSGWRMQPAIYTIVWIVMALGYSYTGVTKLLSPSWIDGSALAYILDNSLTRPVFLQEILSSMPSTLIRMAAWGLLIVELLFAPLALIRRVRPWLWLSLFVMHLGLMSIVEFVDLSTGMILLHFFTFDPAWVTARVPARRKGASHTFVFYDGTCGLCHRTVRFLLAEDAAGLRFRFAPLDSDAFRAASAQSKSGFERSASIPDSVLVQPPGEAMLTRTEGALEIGQQLGGLWRLLAIVVGWIPLTILNTGYDFIARNRHHLFTRPDDVCPILPAHLRDRFQL